MKVKVLVISLMLSVFAFLGVLNSRAISGEREEIAKYYESCIVREIVKCNSKVVLLSTSKSKNLTEYAKIEAKKAKFLNAEKEMLVKDMVEMQLNPKHYKVELYLNSRFREWDRNR